MARRNGKEARNVYGGVGRTEPEPRRGNLGAREKGEDAVGLGQERLDQ